MGVGPSNKQMIDNPSKMIQKLQTTNVAQQLQRPGQYVVQSKGNQSLSNTNIGSSILVWLERHPNIPINRETAQSLREVYTFVEIFADPEIFENYIRQTPANTKIVLVVSGRVGRELIPKIHHSPKLEAVVIYCINVDDNRPWTKSFNKVKDVVSDNNELIEKLREIRRNLENKEEFRSMRIVLPEVPTHQLEIGQMSLFWFQFFLEFLLDSSDLASYQSFNDFLKTVERYVADDLYAKGLLEKFSREYRPEQAISWFLRDGPFRSLVRRALLEYDIPLLFTLRFFLIDIRKQLESNKARSLTVYRYIPMSTEQMETIKSHPGQLLVINSFLLASNDLNQANATVFTDDSMIPVLFQIKTEAMGKTPPFAVLKDEMNLENIQINGSEVLFMAGTTFEIGSLLMERSGWVLHLTMIDHTECHVFQTLKKTSLDQDPSSFVANLLLFCGQRKKAILFSHKLHSILPANHGSRPLLSQNIHKYILSGYSVCLVLQMEKYHTAFSSALLEMISRRAETMVFIVPNVDLNHWRSTGREIHLFTTTEYISSSSTLEKAKDITRYELDPNGKDDEKHRFFTSIDRMMLHLIDRVLESYQRELDEWRSIQAVEETRKTEKKIKEIYEKVRMIDLNAHQETSPIRNLKSPVPLLLILWKSDSKDFDEIKEIFKGKFYDFRIFSDQDVLKRFIVEHESKFNIFLIIQASYSQTTADAFQKYSPVKCVLRYAKESDAPTTPEKSVTQKGDQTMKPSVAESPPISKEKDLIFQLTWNLTRYYPKMAEEYQSQNMLQEAREMLVEAKNLCKFLSVTCFRKI